MTLGVWLDVYCDSAYARRVAKNWSRFLDLKVIWETCLCPRMLLAIVESGPGEFIEIKRSKNSDEIFKASPLYRPGIVGLEYMLVNHKLLLKKTGVRVLRSVCSDFTNVRACEFIRQRVDYPFEDT